MPRQHQADKSWKIEAPTIAILEKRKNKALTPHCLGDSVSPTKRLWMLDVPMKRIDQSQRKIARIVSGGQTGVDRAALDVAIEIGLPHGGWCPNGRRAEDGRIDERYMLDETPTRAYPQRTEWNVRDSDGTLILFLGSLSGGTLLTQQLAQRLNRPCLALNLCEDDLDSKFQPWIHDQSILTLNVAGPRESTCPGIFEVASIVLLELLGNED